MTKLVLVLQQPHLMSCKLSNLGLTKCHHRAAERLFMSMTSAVDATYKYSTNKAGYNFGFFFCPLRVLGGPMSFIGDAIKANCFIILVLMFNVV